MTHENLSSFALINDMMLAQGLKAQLKAALKIQFVQVETFNFCKLIKILLARLFLEYFHSHVTEL